MRKEIVAQRPESPSSPGSPWMDLETHARVRLTSEDSAGPIEFALKGDSPTGWQSARPGPQTIWVDFDVPQDVREIYLRFDSTEARTQEFLLEASTDGGRSYREIVRQQFNFSPGGATSEEERYFPQLTALTGLRLTIVPDISHGEARATLGALRIR